MHYVDLCVEPTLASIARSMGYAHVFSSTYIPLPDGKALSRIREHPIVCTSSTSVDLLKTAASQSRPQSILLIDALSVKGVLKEKGLLSHVKEASNTKPIAFHLPIRSLLLQSFVYRAKYISLARSFAAQCRKARVPLVLSGMAANEYELKSPREHIAIATSIYGMSVHEAKSSLSTTPLHLLSLAGILEEETRTP